jgi:hypothetical protein
MAIGDPKLPRATLRGDQLFIAGEKEPYFRAPERDVTLTVGALTIHDGYEQEDLTERASPKVPSRVSLRGIATIDDEDKFAVAGMKTAVDTPIKFGLNAVPDSETRFHWRGPIWLQMHDWESDIDEAFYFDCHCTSGPFEDVLTAVRTGRVDTLKVRMETTMWTKDKSGYIPTPTTWHLAPPVDRESTSPDHEWGTVLSLTWEEKYGVHPVKSGEDAPAPPPTVVELPPKVYSLLSAIIGILMALLVMAFLRH